MRITSLHQLADPAIAEADAILRSCEHYGFCTAGCPTYVLLGHENDAPRGRIDLIREMLESGGAPKPATVPHIDRCLSCLSCMTTCAIRADYRHLVDRARAHIDAVKSLERALDPHGVIAPGRYGIGRRARASAPKK